MDGRNNLSSHVIVGKGEATSGGDPLFADRGIIVPYLTIIGEAIILVGILGLSHEDCSREKQEAFARTAALSLESRHRRPAISRREDGMAEFHRVCKASEVPDGEGKTVVVGKKLIAVFHTGETYHAIDDCCPHMGASLSGGFLEDGIVTCPWHAWRFRLNDGAWADNPRIKIGSYPVKIEDGDIYVQLDEK
jgi:NAD(P)H-dependent nitrite reductase small subunit